MTFNLEAAERAARLGDKATVVSYLRNACDEIERLRGIEERAKDLADTELNEHYRECARWVLALEPTE